MVILSEYDNKEPYQIELFIFKTSRLPFQQCCSIYRQKPPMLLIVKINQFAFSSSSFVTRFTPDTSLPRNP